MDSDNDGIPDAIEACSNIALALDNCMLPVTASTTFVIDPLTNCNTGKISGSGCTTLTNTDGDALPNFKDLDSDNDCSNDSDEAFVVSDTDCNGKAGVGAIPTVDECGRGSEPTRFVQFHLMPIANAAIKAIAPIDSMTNCASVLPGKIALSTLLKPSASNIFNCETISFTTASTTGYSIVNDTLNYTKAGCYGVIYTKVGTQCTLRDTAAWQVAEAPNGSFSFQTDSICYNGNNVTLVPNIVPGTFTSNVDSVKYNFTLLTGPAIITHPSTGLSEIVGEGVIIVEMEQQFAFQHVAQCL
ncbi:MAG: hypothetical protein IPG00_21260 [Saprospiraceae bacterium]|nr:hypothetical protein [Saprospiraceae bacterium]